MSPFYWFAETWPAEPELCRGPPRQLRRLSLNAQQMRPRWLREGKAATTSSCDDTRRVFHFSLYDGAGSPLKLTIIFDFGVGSFLHRFGSAWFQFKRLRRMCYPTRQANHL
jgi:hypothetical protein